MFICCRFPYDVIVCRLRFLLVLLPYNMTSMSFMLTTVHRYLMIVFNRKNVRFFSLPWQPYVLLATWLLALLVAIPNCLGVVYVWIWRDFCATLSLWGAGINYLTMILIIGLPLVSIPVMYAHIWMVVRRAARNVAQNRSNGVKSARTAGILFVLYLAFVVGYSPYFVYMCIANQLSLTNLKIMFNVIWCLIVLVSSFNPVMYVILFPDVRLGFRRLFKKDSSVDIQNDTIVTQMQVLPK